MDDCRYKLFMNYPASWRKNRWREALPAGNGSIGAAVYGGVRSETILLNHAELWHGGKRDNLPDVSFTLEETRKLMLEGKYREADVLLYNTLKEKGYDCRAASVLPFGDIKVTMPVKKGFRKYSRRLDMRTGEISVSWEDGNTTYERKLFVSRAHDMVVYSIGTDGEPINAAFSLAMHDTGESSRPLNDKEMEQSQEIKVEGCCLYYSVGSDDGTDFGAVMRIIPSAGHLESTEDKIMVQGANGILAFVKLFVKGNRQKDLSRLHDELEAICGDYESLLIPHVHMHSQLFESASITLSEGQGEKSNEELLLQAYQGELPNSLAEKMWAYGRYLFISAVRTGGLPCALYGLWCGDYHPWWSQHVANENVEMIYWHTAVGGLQELTLSLFNHFDSLMEDFRENARKLFGCKGINIHAYTSPGIGGPGVPVPVIIHWTGAAGWLARHYYEYFLYTGDMEFLKNRALPFMREAALFYEDFLIRGEDGTISVFPSISPENSPSGFHDNDFGLGHPMPTTINATMEMAIIKELLGNLIQAARITGKHLDEIAKWEEILKKIPGYQLNEDGAIREWMHPDFEDNYNHRHMSHIYPVFPGQEISRENHPELFEAFVKAIRKRLVVGISDQSGWSLAHMACIYARMGDGDSALECLELLSRSCLMNNFFTTHNDWRGMGITLEIPEAPFQIDANMGWTNAVQEMLLYSAGDMVKLLPALPSRWKRGTVRDLHFCSGKVTFSWDIQEGKFHAELLAERDTIILLKLPDVFCGYSFMGGAVVTPSGDLGCYFGIEMNAGTKLEVDSEIYGEIENGKA